MANPAPTINQINAFNATQGTIIDFNIIGGTELVRSNRIYIYDLSDNSLICTHLYVSTESIHELPANTDSSIVYESGKSSADFVNGAQYYAQIQTFTDIGGTEGGSGLSVAKMFWCLVDPTLTITTIPSTISTTSYNVSATYTDTSASVVSNIIQQYQFSLYSATGSLLQSSGVIVGSGTQQGTSTVYDISYNFTGLSVGSSYYVVVDVTTTQGMNVSTQSNTFTVSIETPTLGEATVVNNACDGYISVTSNLSGEYGGSASGEIATFVTDSVNDVSSLKVTLTPQQDGTPWIGTDHDTTPYLNRAMPTQSNDYNRESGVIVGGTVGWNQLADIVGYQSPLNGVTFTVNSDGSVTVNGTASGNARWSGYIAPAIVGHVYYSQGCPSGGSDSTYRLYSSYIGASLDCGSGRVVKHGGSTSYPDARAEIFISSGYTANNLVFKPQYFDLTAMFGSTIADYIYSLEQATTGAGVAWFRKYFPEDYYPYSANTLQSVQATAHKTYDGDGNVLGNYALDSSVTLQGVFQLDNGELKAYGDIYPPSGDIQRKFAKVDLGSLNWLYDEGIFYTQDIRPWVKVPSAVADANDITCIAEGYVTVWSRLLSRTTAKTTFADKDIGITNSGATGNIVIRNDSYTDYTAFKNAMSGVYMVVEVATPTTETAQAYTNPQVVDPDGTEEYVTANNVPVGHDSTYSLECPISGYDEVEANVVGKNLLELPFVHQSTVAVSKANCFRILAGDYTFSFASIGTATTWRLCLYMFDESGNALLSNEYNPNVAMQSTGTYWRWGSNASDKTASIHLTTDCYIRLVFSLGDTTSTMQSVNAQLELGNQATDYEPYQGQTYTADLPQTVYGGTVDLVSGELTVTDVVDDMGNLNFGKSQTTSGGFTGYLSQRYNTKTDSLIMRSSVYTFDGGGNINRGYYGASGTFRYFYSGANNTNNEIYVRDEAYADATAAEFATAMTGQKILYPLATPQTIQLTPQEIRTLLGTNNVWSDSGDVEITYNIPITNLLVKRQDVADVSGTWLTLYSQPVTQASDMDFTFIDFLNQYGKTYKYALVPLLTQTQSGVEVEVEGGYTVSDEVQSIFDGVFIADATELQKCKANVGYGDVDMNQAVGTITPIGSKYPVVITNSKNQYHNGSISGTIVPDDYYSNGNLSRIDMVNKRNELEQFLTNKRAKIIKDWNSNIWLVMIMDNINCTFNNEYGMGIVNFTANWIEVGDPTNQQDLQATGLIDVGGV